MNKRFPALIALVSVLVLAACDTGNTPQPTATTAPAEPTPVAEVTATTAAPEAATATTVPAAEPTNTAAPAAEATATAPPARSAG